MFVRLCCVNDRRAALAIEMALDPSLSPFCDLDVNQVNLKVRARVRKVAYEIINNEARNPTSIVMLLVDDMVRLSYTLTGGVFPAHVLKNVIAIHS